MIKQATTIDEQIKLLKTRGMAVPDEDKAKEILMDIGFYRLGFYAFPFEKSFPSLTNRSHEYKPDSTFTDVVELYYFDYDLRKILTYYLNRIEINLRTYITYTISNHYKESPTWFVDPSIMRPTYIADFESKVYRTIRENPVIKRHHSRYKDHYAPAWKTMEFMTLGNICSLFNNLKDDNLKEQIARHYKCGLGIFLNYLETIRVIRNTCAHGGCIYNISLAKSIKSSPQVPISGAERHNIRGIIRVISFMIGIISENRKKDLQREVTALLDYPRSRFTKHIISLCTGFTVK